MIRYQLRCAKDHEFEAWFRDSAAFDTQSKGRKVLCPDCGSTKVIKAPMAPSIGKRSEAQPQAPAAAAPADASAPVPTPTQIRAYLRAMQKHVETTHEYVGQRFSEEARKIHYGESKERGIYGEATPKDAKELVDEGIDVAAVPWLREDA
jgi:hypothetical protein